MLTYMTTTLETYRLKEGISQAELARRAGVDQATISRLERTGARPQDTTKVKIAAALGVDPMEIFPLPVLSRP